MRTCYSIKRAIKSVDNDGHRSKSVISSTTPDFSFIFFFKFYETYSFANIKAGSLVEVLLTSEHARSQAKLTYRSKLVVQIMFPCLPF